MKITKLSFRSEYAVYIIFFLPSKGKLGISMQI